MKIPGVILAMLVAWAVLATVLVAAFYRRATASDVEAAGQLMRLRSERDGFEQRLDTLAKAHEREKDEFFAQHLREVVELSNANKSLEAERDALKARLDELEDGAAATEPSAPSTATAAAEPKPAEHAPKADEFTAEDRISEAFIARTAKQPPITRLWKFSRRFKPTAEYSGEPLNELSNEDLGALWASIHIAAIKGVADSDKFRKDLLDEACRRYKWTKPERLCVEGGLIWEGMSAAHLYWSVGHPDSVQHVSRPGNEFQYWRYEPLDRWQYRCEFTIRNKRVEDWVIR